MPSECPLTKTRSRACCSSHSKPLPLYLVDSQPPFGPKYHVPHYQPLQNCFFFPLWIYSMCGRSCLTPHLMSSWFLYLGEFRERFLLLPHLTFPSAMEISIFVLVFIKMGNLQGELYPLSIQWPWGLPSENMITQHWGLWPSHRGLAMMSWHTMLEMWSLMGICPGSTWASQAYHQHFWYIPSLLSQPSHPHR